MIIISGCTSPPSGMSGVCCHGTNCYFEGRGIPFSCWASLAPLLIPELLHKIVYPSLSNGIWSVPLLGLGQSVSVHKQHVMCFLRKTVEWN